MKSIVVGYATVLFVVLCVVAGSVWLTQRGNGPSPPPSAPSCHARCQEIRWVAHQLTMLSSLSEQVLTPSGNYAFVVTPRAALVIARDDETIIPHRWWDREAFPALDAVIATARANDKHGLVAAQNYLGAVAETIYSRS